MSIFRLAFAFAMVAAVCAAGFSLAAMSVTQKRTAILERERRLAPTRHGEIEYVIAGTHGEPKDMPILVIHGAGGGVDQGLLLARAMAPADAHIISVSRFGYLGSAMPPDPSTRAQAEAFADLLDVLEIDRVHLLAMSGGAPPALKFAEMYPERTARLALLSSAPFTPFSPEVEARPIPTWMYSALLGNDIVYWMLTKVARHQLATAFDARPDLRADLSAEETAFVSDLIDGFLPASRRLGGVNNEGAAVAASAQYNIELIAAPMLVVHAADDMLNPVEVAEYLHGRAVDAKYIRLERGGHLLLGNHERLRREIQTFLASPAPL